MSDMEELVDLLDSMVVKCHISLFLIQCGKTAWLPTILEALYQDAQSVLDGWCVEEISS